MKKVINNIEFRTCTFTANDGSTVSGLYVHDLADEFGNGDCVISDVDMPESEQEAMDMLINEYSDSDCETLATVKF